MRVLFQGYSTYAQNKSGGVQVRMRQLASHLRKSGVDVDFFEHNTTDISQYDILHIFSLNAEHYNLVNYAHRKGVKVVLSSIVTCRWLENRFAFNSGSSSSVDTL